MGFQFDLMWHTIQSINWLMWWNLHNGRVVLLRNHLMLTHGKKARFVRWPGWGRVSGCRYVWIARYAFIMPTHTNICKMSILNHMSANCWVCRSSGCHFSVFNSCVCVNLIVADNQQIWYQAMYLSSFENMGCLPVSTQVRHHQKNIFYISK